MGGVYNEIHTSCFGTMQKAKGSIFFERVRRREVEMEASSNVQKSILGMPSLEENRSQIQRDFSFPYITHGGVILQFWNHCQKDWLRPV